MSEIATQELARARAARIRAGIGAYLATLADVAAAYAQRDWKALGYKDWQGYVDGEYGADRLKLTPEHRQKAVAELRLAGMSQRAIGSALGVSKATVANDLSDVVNSDHLPEIQGADGKTYAATRPDSPTGPGAAPVAEFPQDPDRSGTTAAVEAQFGAPADGADDSGTAVESHPVRTGEFPAVEPAAPARPGPVEGSPGPGRVTPHDPDEFAATLDRLVPDPDAPHREWRRAYIDRLIDGRRPMRPGVDQVVENADDQLVDELRRLAEDINTFYESVRKGRLSRFGSNVHPIRRAQ